MLHFSDKQPFAFRANRRQTPGTRPRSKPVSPDRATMAAPDPFESAKLLIERAGEHVDDFKRKCDEFFKRKPYAQFVDTQSKPGKELYKLRLTEEIPVRWSTIVADAISNLRHALDHAIGASARAAGATRLKAVYFPFCGDAGELESTIRS